MGGGRGDRTLHRRLRRGGVRNPARPLGRRALCFWALLALIVFGIVAIFVNIPNSALIYATAGLVAFAGFTMYDFQRLRKNEGHPRVPLLAASTS